MGQIEVHLIDHIVVFFLVIALPAAALMAPSRPFEEVEVTAELKKSLYLNNALLQWLGTLVIMAVWYFSDRSWGVLGFQPTRQDAHPLWFFLIIAFVILYAANTLYGLYWPGERKKLLEKWRDMMPFIPTTWQDQKWWLIAALSAGICEEIIFRGYLINYLLSVFEGSRSALFFALAIPAVSFGLAHLYQGPSAVVKIVLMAFTFGLIFVLTESLIALMLVHIAVDFIIGIIGIYVTERGLLLRQIENEEE